MHNRKTKKITLLILIILFLGLVFEIFWIERKLDLKMPEIFVADQVIAPDIVVNVNQELGPVNPVWRALAQGGEEPGKQMLASTVSHVKRIGPDYIRLDHIYDDDYYDVVKGRDQAGNLILDWSRLDKTVNDILASGAKPFFSLSYMPKELSDTKVGVPDWKLWQELVRKTVEHYSSQIDGIYYEVWNEPSLPSFGGWKMYGAKDYRQLYYYSVAGANNAQNVKEYKIGGPSIPELDPKWIELLFDFVLERGLRLDFISWHRYSFNPDQFVEDVYYINRLTAKPKYASFRDTEKVITEWGPNSYKDKVYSSQVAASHAVTTIRKLLDKVSYAFAFEIKDGPNQGEDAWGLLSHEDKGVKLKPRYYLFKWLAELDGFRVPIQGEGTNVKGFAVKNDNTITLILSNYGTKDLKQEKVPLTFSGLRGEKYRFYKQELFRKPTEDEVSVQGSTFSSELVMQPYSVVRVRLTKLDVGAVSGNSSFGELINSESEGF